MAEHPCVSCGKPTTNPKVCSRLCGARYRQSKSSMSQPGPRPHKRTSLRDRFFRSLGPKPTNPSECWTWYGYRNSSGYAEIWGGVERDKKKIYAHRLSYELFKGPIPEGHVVSQTCENFMCVNPVHLVCGTRKEIVGRRLRLNHKTARYGDQNPFSRLTDEDVQRIRELHSERKFSEIRILAKQRNVNPEYAVAIGRAKGRNRRY